MKKLIATTLICFAVSGCSSLNEAKLDTKSPSNYIGENVKVTTISDKTFEFKVEGATELAMYGEGKTINIADIKKIEVEEFSPLKSFSLAGGLYMLGAIVLTIAVL
ncbi:hypothetical protein HG547_04480 [Shewanella sp. DNRA4]|uniref:Uncharacterized protein n=1 Tax=Shewanella decolorationis TaxID=256839 RepID=A0A5B8QTQ0_9GAMM|nr:MULTISPECIES: hypothetical protein [Shewanella]NMD50887.1 hypothetical protein [Shewanella sp. DNRA4]QDZ90040.1 hypothetical protein D0436_05845 [Shewanella decolorationis]